MGYWEKRYIPRIEKDTEQVELLTLRMIGKKYSTIELMELVGIKQYPKFI